MKDKNLVYSHQWMTGSKWDASQSLFNEWAWWVPAQGRQRFWGHKVKFNEIFKRETNVNKECMCTPSEN